MILYCLKSRKNTKIKNPKVLVTKNERVLLSSQCAVHDDKKLRFIKQQEASRILNSVDCKHL